MINYQLNQRRSVRYTGSGWVEEVLAASGVEIDNTNFGAISGTQVQQALDSIDNVLEGLTATPASGVLIIDDVANVSGTVGGTLQNLDVISLTSASDSVFKFSFSVPAQPVDPVHVRFVYAARGAVSGTLSGTLEYNVFDQGDDLTPGASYTYSVPVSQTLVAGDQDKMKLLNMTIPLPQFSSGSAPFIVDAKFTRNTNVSGNYGADISIVQIYADNIPGGATGNSAGYVGGNLEVTGDLVVQGTAILAGGSAPASISGAGTTGSVVIAGDYLYAATATNTWKRIILSDY